MLGVADLRQRPVDDLVALREDVQRRRARRLHVDQDCVRAHVVDRDVAVVREGDLCDLGTNVLDELARVLESLLDGRGDEAMQLGLVTLRA